MKKRNLSLWAVLFWLLVWQAGSMALHSDICLLYTSDAADEL